MTGRAPTSFRLRNADLEGVAGDLEHVSGLEPATFDHLTIHERAIGAFQILDPDLIVFRNDLAVTL